MTYQVFVLKIISFSIWSKKNHKKQVNGFLLSKIKNNKEIILFYRL